MPRTSELHREVTELHQKLAESVTRELESEREIRMLRARLREQGERLPRRAALDASVNDVVLILDPEEAFADPLGESFREFGFQPWLCRDLGRAREVARTSPPALIVSELRVEGQWVFDFIDDLQIGNMDGVVVVATAYPSVATAVRTVRSGFAGYVCKPVNARAILDLARSDSPADVATLEAATRWPSLDRTIWEYLNQVLGAAGTMSEAARRLGIDRRSLRRMLSKHPPAR